MGLAVYVIVCSTFSRRCVILLKFYGSPVWCTLVERRGGECMRGCSSFSSCVVFLESRVKEGEEEDRMDLIVNTE